MCIETELVLIIYPSKNKTNYVFLISYLIKVFRI